VQPSAGAPHAHAKGRTRAEKKLSGLGGCLKDLDPPRASCGWTTFHGHLPFPSASITALTAAWCMRTQ
jgi:hypothetical protein